MTEPVHNYLVQAANATNANPVVDLGVESVVLPERAQFCSYCGLPLFSFGTERLIVGPCCEGIAPANHAARRQVGQPLAVPVEIPEDEEEDEAHPDGVCQTCGHTAFTFEYTESVTRYMTSRGHSSEDGASVVMLSYDWADTQDEETNDTEMDQQSICCRSCGAQYEGDWEWE